MLKQKSASASLQILIIGLLIVFLSVLLYSLASLLKRGPTEVQTYAGSDITVVIDAGHGGEDGGTSDKNGNLEKDINLSLAKKLSAAFASAGIKTVMTRTEDKLLYDPSSDYEGRKKILDMRERVKIVSECENPVFISIHMNAFPEEKYSGLQVYYSVNDAFSEKLAQSIQGTVCSLIQNGNHRKIKRGKDIFLLDRITSPAVLVECGFLSNPHEAALLSDEKYLDSLAFAIFYAVLSEIQ